MFERLKWEPKSLLRISAIAVFVLVCIDSGSLALLKKEQELCLPEKGLFECSSLEACIPASKVCDGKANDCPDGSDEWARCETSCSTMNCEHGCVPNIEPGRNGTCFCNDGFKPTGSKQTRCKNVNECEIWGICSQLCEDSPGSYKCSCQPGFNLQSDNGSCVVADPNIQVVYATKKSVHVFNLNEGKHYSIVENSGQNVAVAVDIANRKVLWTDISDKREAIYRRSIDGNGTTETVVDYGLEIVEGLAFDWITGNIYIVDSKKRHIAACSNNGYQCTVLVKEFLYSPREIVLHPNEGYMFWSNWGEQGSIIKAQMDGVAATPIVSKNLHWPNGLAIDYANARLYWSDARADLIETVNLDGGDRRVVRSAGNTHHFSLDLFGDRLYWSDWEAKEIHSCNKFTGKDIKVVVHDANSDGKVNQPYGLSIFHPAAQPKTRRNQCASANCIYMCLLSPNNTSSCACPTGLKLDRSGRDCIDDDRTAKIVIGHQNRIGLYRYGSIGRNLVQEIQLKEKAQIGAVHYNAVNETIFVSDMFWHKIYEFNPRTKKIDTIIRNHIDTVTGLSLDVVGQNLYWADYSRRKIEVLSLKTGARALISSEKDSPQDLIVVPEKKFLFVTLTSSRWGRIMKYNMNGYNRTTLVRISRGEPIALAYNRELERIFWSDVYKQTIEHISLDGREQSTAVRETGVFSIASFANHIYWTDRHTQLLNAMTVLGADFVEQPVYIGDYEDRQNTTLMSYIEGNFLAKISILQKNLKIYDELLERHECSVTKRVPMKCSHICLMSNDDFVGTCLCPDGMELEQDLRTCAPKCYADQFQCRDKKCIAGDWKCDGFNDCTGGEDEQDCIKPNTPMCDPLDLDCLLHQTSLSLDVESTTAPTTKVPSSSSGRDDTSLSAPRPKYTTTPWTTSTTERPRDSSWPIKTYFGSFSTSQRPQKESSRPSKDPRVKVISPLDEVSQSLDDSTGSSSSRGNGRDRSESDEITLQDRALEDDLLDGPLRSQTKNDDNGGSTATAVVITVVLLILIVTIIIGFILHKRRISPKTLVQPYVQQLVKYVNRPVQRWNGNNGGNKREQFRNDNVYDETFDTINGSYGPGQFANPTYEEIDNLQQNEWNRNNSDSSKGESRSADSGILTVMDTDPSHLYEDIDDHYTTYSQKQKLLVDEKDLV